MAHLENGFSQIANETLEALARTRLSGNERRILDVVFRRTYGIPGSPIWARISMRYYSKATGIDFRNCHRIEKRLRKRNIIIRDRGRVRFQKYSAKWKNVGVNDDGKRKLEGLRTRDKTGKREIVVDNDDVVQNDDKSVVQNDDKYNTKDNIKKKKVPKKKKGRKPKIYLEPFLGEFENVQLTQSEFDKLVDRFGKDVALQWIENASGYFEQIGARKTAAKYKSHYACILNWDRMERKRFETSGSPAARKKREDAALRNWYRRNVTEGKK